MPSVYVYYLCMYSSTVLCTEVLLAAPTQIAAMHFAALRPRSCIVRALASLQTYIHPSTKESLTLYIRSLFLGAARMILSTRNNNSAASLAELTTAFFNL